MKDLRIYVVSLAKNNPRRAGLAEALAPLGRPYEIVDAVDGRRGLGKAWESEIDREEASRREGYCLTDGELACSLSHRIAWERFLRAGFPSASSYQLFCIVLSLASFSQFLVIYDLRDSLRSFHPRQNPSRLEFEFPE